MELNKSYYLSLGPKLEIISGEIGHNPIDEADLEEIKSVVSEPLTSGSLFTGDHLVTKEVKKFDILTGKQSSHTKVENLANLAIGEGFIRIVEYNMQTRQLRLWIQHPDYKKKESTASQELNPGGPKF